MVKLMIYRIADFNFILNDLSVRFRNQLTDYVVENQNADAEFSCTEDEIMAEQDASGSFTRGYLRFIALHRKIAEWLPLRDAFVLHSACFDVDGVGVAFAAHSGTGKSTHMMRWMDYLGDRMTIVNGDKPIVRFFEDKPDIPYAYGTPWNGKERLGCNMRTPLKHICFIERSDKNYVEKAEKTVVIDRIFNQVYMPKEPMAVVKTMRLIDRLLSSCQLWIIHCNMDENAGEIAYKQIFEK